MDIFIKNILTNEFYYAIFNLQGQEREKEIGQEPDRLFIIVWVGFSFAKDYKKEDTPMHNEEPFYYFSCHIAGCEVASISCIVAGSHWLAELTAEKNWI